MTGVMADAMTVPLFHTWEVTMPAAPDAIAAITRVESESPSRFGLRGSAAIASGTGRGRRDRRACFDLGDRAACEVHVRQPSKPI